MLALGLILACLLGLIPAAIAQSKGRSFAGWWVFGALLFIVALPCALLVSRVGPAPETGADRRPCPHCAELVLREAVVCRYCGRDIEPLPRSAPPSSAFAAANRGSVAGGSPRAKAVALAVILGGVIAWVVISPWLSPAAPASDLGASTTRPDPNAFVPAFGGEQGAPLMACAKAGLLLQRRGVSRAKSTYSPPPWIVGTRFAEGGVQARCAVQTRRGDKHGFIIATRLCADDNRDACVRPEQLELAGELLFRRKGFAE